MAKIYLIRHAESIANTLGIYQGQTYDTGLSSRGKMQATLLADRLYNIPFARIITSPLHRTRQTAFVVAQYRKDVILHIEPRIIETNHGKWEGIPKNEVLSHWEKLYHLWLTSPKNICFPEGECFSETQKRTISWWNEISQAQNDVVVVTHDNIIRIIITHVLDLQDNYFWRFRLYPTGITLIESKYNNQRIITINDSCHLPELQIDIGVHAL